MWSEMFRFWAAQPRRPAVLPADRRTCLAARHGAEQVVVRPQEAHLGDGARQLGGGAPRRRPSGRRLSRRVGERQQRGSRLPLRPPQVPSGAAAAAASAAAASAAAGSATAVPTAGCGATHLAPPSPCRVEIRARFAVPQSDVRLGSPLRVDAVFALPASAAPVPAVPPTAKPSLLRVLLHYLPPAVAPSRPLAPRREQREKRRKKRV